MKNMKRFAKNTEASGQLASRSRATAPFFRTHLGTEPYVAQVFICFLFLRYSNTIDMILPSWYLFHYCSIFIADL
jgi:hypothetical protein